METQDKNMGVKTVLIPVKITTREKLKEMIQNKDETYDDIINNNLKE